MSHVSLPIGLSSLMMQQNEGGHCLPTDGVTEGDSPKQHCVHCTIKECNDGELLHILDVTALWTVVRLSYSSTLSKLSNHPVYWMIVRLFFHSIMLSSYCGSILWKWTRRELSLWIFYWLSCICPLAKLVIYVGFVINTMTWMILSRANRISLRKRNRYQKRVGYCRRKMILSAYMHSWEWTGFLRKLNREPILMIDNIHRISMKGSFLFGIFMCF